jgi:CheY-like chemotaxis protein
VEYDTFVLEVPVIKCRPKRTVPFCSTEKERNAQNVGAADLTVTRKQIEILVVESDPADANLTEIAFKKAGLTSGFRSVSDGADALAYVHKQGKYANVATPDLIFLDLSLPKVSGLEVLKAIKSTPHLMHIPIVVASGSEDPEHMRFMEMCYEFWGSVVTLSPPTAPGVPVNK